jgi:hypothetical protein
MNDREAAIERLSGPNSTIGTDRRDAELRTADLDLWIQDPEVLFGFEPEDAVKQWSKAVAVLSSFADVAEHINEATLQAMMDARERARVALVRAQERERENS